MRFSKKLIAAIAKNDFIWTAFARSVIPAANYGQWARKYRNHLQLIPEAVSSRIPKLTVLNGPFAGLVYPSVDASLASLFAKLLGSYEREIHPVVEKICTAEYTDIVNVGCAEGYYAVG